MQRGGSPGRLPPRRTSNRDRTIQLILVAFVTYAAIRFMDSRTRLPWTDTLRCSASDGSILGRKGCQTIIGGTALVATPRERNQNSGVAARLLDPPEEGIPLPVFNLSACMEDPPEPSGDRFMTTDMFLAGVPTRLKLHKTLLSQSRPAPSETTVLVTFDVGRLYMLDGLCLAWGGAISVAVYQAVDDGPPHVEGAAKDEVLRDAEYRIADFHTRVTAQRTCMLDIMLFSEALSSTDPFIRNLYPVNALRNRAMLMVTTALVMVLDGDLLPQADMRARLAAGTPRGDALLSGAAAREFHVLPSFDTHDTSLAYFIAGGSKAAVVAAYNSGSIVRFGARNSSYPQGCTNYDRWKRASQQYTVEYCNRYEPWGIVAREHSPWFDSRFRGYGRNKIMYSAALNSSGFEFVIEPDTFVIHRPHPKSNSQRVFHHKEDRRVHDYVMDMWTQQAKSGKFEAMVDKTALRCKQQLPWWKGVAMHVGRPTLDIQGSVLSNRSHS